MSYYYKSLLIKQILVFLLKGLVRYRDSSVNFDEVYKKVDDGSRSVVGKVTIRTLLCKKPCTVLPAARKRLKGKSLSHGVTQSDANYPHINVRDLVRRSRG